MKRSRRLEQLQRPQSLLDHIRQFLTPRVWKQARHAAPRRRDPARWDLQPLVLILLAMTWAAGDSQPERFVMARGFYVASYRARRRPARPSRDSRRPWPGCRCDRCGPWPPACDTSSAVAMPSDC